MNIRKFLIQLSITVLILIVFGIISLRQDNKEYEELEKVFPTIITADSLNDVVTNIDYPENVRSGHWFVYLNLSNLGNRTLSCHESNEVVIGEVLTAGSIIIKEKNSDTVIVKNNDKPDHYFILLKKGEDPFE